MKVRFDELRRQHEAEASGTARKALADPNAYDLAALNEPQRKALIRFWEAWQEVLKRLRILDPACGSGAFLIEAFDQLHALYEISNARLEELRGHRTLFDLDRQILQHNLYGVDLNAEAIQICQLSLWIKTAAHGKVLTSLDHTIREGNSVVSDPTVHPKAFDWQAASRSLRAGRLRCRGRQPALCAAGFAHALQAVAGSPLRNLSRQSGPLCLFLRTRLRVLRPGGLLSFIVTNKWMKAGYGEPLRRFFSEKAWVRSVVDFGHAKQIFEEADVFPCIIVVEKADGSRQTKDSAAMHDSREQLRIDDLSVQIEQEGLNLETRHLGTEPWQLEPKAVTDLLTRLRGIGVPLAKFVGQAPIYGVKTVVTTPFFLTTTAAEGTSSKKPGCCRKYSCVTFGDRTCNAVAVRLGWRVATRPRFDQVASRRGLGVAARMRRPSLPRHTQASFGTWQKLVKLCCAKLGLSRSGGSYRRFQLGHLQKNEDHLPRNPVSPFVCTGVRRILLKQ